MTTDLQVATPARPPVVAKNAAIETVTGGRPYLTFRLAGEVYAIDILRIREIIEYTLPTAVPMMPPTVRGVINLRGAVVPVVDLAVRFGLAPTGVGKRTCIVIVEVAHAGTTQVLGLMVDGVNAVLEISGDEVEPPPSFGTQANAEFIEGMARLDGRFVILLAIERVLSIDEMATVGAIKPA